MIEDYTLNDKNDETKNYAPDTFGPKTFQPSQLKRSIYAKNS